MVERYLVLESSQSGFRNYRAVQMVKWKNNGTLIRVDLDLKNAFTSAGHSCVWTILEGCRVLDVWMLKNIYENSSMRVQVGGLRRYLP